MPNHNDKPNDKPEDLTEILRGRRNSSYGVDLGDQLLTKGKGLDARDVAEILVSAIAYVSEKSKDFQVLRFSVDWLECYLNMPDDDSMEVAKKTIASQVEAIMKSKRG